MLILLKLGLKYFSYTFRIFNCKMFIIKISALEFKVPKINRKNFELILKLL